MMATTMVTIQDPWWKILGGLPRQQSFQICSKWLYQNCQEMMATAASTRQALCAKRSTRMRTMGLCPARLGTNFSNPTFTPNMLSAKADASSSKGPSMVTTSIILYQRAMLPAARMGAGAEAARWRGWTRTRQSPLRYSSSCASFRRTRRGMERACHPRDRKRLEKLSRRLSHLPTSPRPYLTRSTFFMKTRNCPGILGGRPGSDRLVPSSFAFAPRSGLRILFPPVAWVEFS
mmetsp:Transcript_19150/g.55675  ORF Transcript_19150/g.55675 Transcript_19150/m.55675 type:complete len:233 (+) Transcript_19150:383-1081(+)